MENAASNLNRSHSTGSVRKSTTLPPARNVCINSPKTCFRCGEPKLGEPPIRPWKSVLGKLIGMELEPEAGPLAMAEVEVNGFKFIAQWDGASPYSIVGPQAGKLIQQQGSKVNKLVEPLWGAEGSALNILGWSTVEIKLPGKHTFHPVVICDNF